MRYHTRRKRMSFRGKRPRMRGGYTPQQQQQQQIPSDVPLDFRQVDIYSELTDLENKYIQFSPPQLQPKTCLVKLGVRLHFDKYRITYKMDQFFYVTPDPPVHPPLRVRDLPENTRVETDATAPRMTFILPNTVDPMHERSVRGKYTVSSYSVTYCPASDSNMVVYVQPTRVLISPGARPVFSPGIAVCASEPVRYESWMVLKRCTDAHDRTEIWETTAGTVQFVFAPFPELFRPDITYVDMIGFSVYVSADQEARVKYKAMSTLPDAPTTPQHIGLFLPQDAMANYAAVTEVALQLPAHPAFYPYHLTATILGHVCVVYYIVTMTAETVTLQTYARTAGGDYVSKWLTVRYRFVCPTRYNAIVLSDSFAWSRSGGLQPVYMDPDIVLPVFTPPSYTETTRPPCYVAICMHGVVLDGALHSIPNTTLHISNALGTLGHLTVHYEYFLNAFVKHAIAGALVHGVASIEHRYNELAARYAQISYAPTDPAMTSIHQVSRKTFEQYRAGSLFIRKKFMQSADEGFLVPNMSTGVYFLNRVYLPNGEVRFLPGADLTADQEFVTYVRGRCRNPETNNDRLYSLPDRVFEFTSVDLYRYLVYKLGMTDIHAYDCSCNTFQPNVPPTFARKARIALDANQRQAYAAHMSALGASLGPVWKASVAQRSPDDDDDGEELAVVNHGSQDTIVAGGRRTRRRRKPTKIQKK